MLPFVQNAAWPFREKLLLKVWLASGNVKSLLLGLDQAILGSQPTLILAKLRHLGIFAISTRLTVVNLAALFKTARTLLSREP